MDSIWLNYDEILSKNRALNFIVGPRGKGKTYGYLKWHIKRFIKLYYKRKELGLEPIIEEDIYMRRYKSELDDSFPELYNKVMLEFPNYEFRYKGKIWQIRKKKKEEDEEEDEWITLTHKLSLTTAYHMKGRSFPNVKYMCYDEFLYELGIANRELKQEVNKFLNALETVFRMRDDFRVFLLGNATTFETCYKYEFNLQLPYNAYYWYSKEKSILVHLANNPGFIEVKKASLIGRLSKGTSYEEGMIDNNFYCDSITFIRKKKGNYNRISTFTYKGRFYAIYYKNKRKGYEIIIDKVKNHMGLIADFVIKSDEMNPNRANMIFNRENPVYKLLQRYFNRNCLFYQTITVKSQLHPLFMKIL